jgi:hypothetical protein
MLWMGVIFVAGFIIVMVVGLRKRPVDVRALGSVSRRWITDHLGD